VTTEFPDYESFIILGHLPAALTPRTWNAENHCPLARILKVGKTSGYECLGSQSPNGPVLEGALAAIPYYNLLL